MREPLHRQDSDAGVVRFETKNTTAFVEEHAGYVTLLWESRCSPADSIRLLEPVVACSDPHREVGMLFVSHVGQSAFRDGREKVTRELDEAARAPEIVATVRVECVVEDIGSIALAYQRAAPGVRGPTEGAISITARSLDHGCLRSIFTNSAMPALSGRYDELVQAAEDIAALPQR